KQQATLYLENAHRGRPQGRLRLAVEPDANFSVLMRLHQGRDDVRIENDHSSKSIGRSGVSGSLGSGASLSGQASKGAALLEPRPYSSLSGFSSSARRMERASSSMLTPWRLARLRRFSLTSVSSLRIRSWAMMLFH